MDVSENRGTPKSSILGFSILNHPFWGTPIFGNPQMEIQTNDGYRSSKCYFKRPRTNCCTPKTVFTEEAFVFHDVYTPGVYTLHKKYWWDWKMTFTFSGFKKVTFQVCFSFVRFREGIRAKILKGSSSNHQLVLCMLVSGDWLSQWPTFKLLGIPYLVGKIKV